jgi:DNA polymerase III delta subunit
MTLFFYGPNTFALRQQLGQMMAAYRQKTGSDFGLERIDGATVKLQELAAQLQATPFLAASRLVIIEGVGVNKGVVEKLPNLLKSVPPTTVAVFVETDLDQRSAGFKALMKAEKVVKFDALSGSQLLAWAGSEVKRLGGSVEQGALRYLIDRVGDDQWRLAGEINKLVNYGQITKQSVDEMVSTSLERSIFSLVDAMTAGKTGDALTAYRALSAARESEMYVLTMVQWQLRNLLLAKLAPGDMPAAAFAGATGMSAYVAEKMRGVLGRRLKEETLVSAYEAACDTEFDIKTGRMKGPEAVERLIYRVAASVG